MLDRIEAPRLILLSACVALRTAVKCHQIYVLFGIGVDFLGVVGANAPRENSSVGALHPEEFEPKISANCPAIQNMVIYLCRSLHLQRAL